MREMRQDRLAFDLQSARSIDLLSGHMHVAQTNISKATVNDYRGSEIPGSQSLGLDSDKVYKLLRDPKELEAAAKSFNGKPLVMVHREQAVDDADHNNRVGSAYNATYEHPYLKADLAVLDKAAIDAIESGDQRELSCGYGYKPDMTPGEYEGVKYDGVMRQIGGNHVALVREGRAGPDCYVFDSMENLRMTKTVLSRKAVAAQGALVAYLAPKMAKDAKIDLTPTLKDVTSKNFADKKATIAQDVLRQVKGKIAKDEDVNLEKVAEIIEAIASVEPAEPEVVDTLTPPTPDPDPNAMDDDDEDLVKKLVAKGYSEEEAKRIAARTPAPAAADDNDDRDVEQREKDGRAFVKKVTGMDIKDLKGMVTKTAMDQALAAAVQAAEKRVAANQTAIRDAERFVRPWVGDLAMSFDSAPDVFRKALGALGIDAAEMHQDALRPVLEAQPKPGDKRPTIPAHIAQDSAQSSEYTKRFGDHSTRLKH